MVLGFVVNLSLPYWRDHFFFMGADDANFFQLTGGEFPKKIEPGKTHPIFTLKALPNHVGYRVCPCSSRKPFDRHHYRYINKGCRLEFTNHEMDRNSYLVENILLNLPPTIAIKFRFKGQVPNICLMVKKK
ncbi:MAG: hypothetical protein SRB2_03586 [Desulfobacteraceae bacterium Eth-SRB2]|nr:MAG: hypothetical protein SRB2_03586 [Desulfobacteraceae bacterium Eth-SRB2]